MIKDIKANYKEPEQNKANFIGKAAGKGIDWVKNEKKNKAFKGNLAEFITQRSNELGLGVEESKSLRQGDFALPEKRGRLQRFFDKVQEFFGTQQEGAKLISNPVLQNTTANLKDMKLQPIKQTPKTRDRADAFAFTTPERAQTIIDEIKEQSEAIGKKVKSLEERLNQEKTVISPLRTKTVSSMER